VPLVRLCALHSLSTPHFALHQKWSLHWHHPTLNTLSHTPNATHTRTPNATHTHTHTHPTLHTHTHPTLHPHTNPTLHIHTQVVVATISFISMAVMNSGQLPFTTSDTAPLLVRCCTSPGGAGLIAVADRFSVSVLQPMYVNDWLRVCGVHVCSWHLSPTHLNSLIMSPTLP
jgi:hypothetical protein